MKNKVIKLQVPTCTVFVLVGTSRDLGLWLEELKSDIGEAAKKMLLDTNYINSFDHCNGRFVRMSSRNRLVFINGKFPTKRKRSILVHEIIHAVDDISKFFEINDTEYRAYLGEYIYEACEKLC